VRQSVRTDLYAGGCFRPARSGQALDLVNPATEQVIGSVPACDAADVDSAVQAARAALPGWRSSRPGDRALVLEAVADAYRKRADELGALVTEENGSPFWWTQQENVMLAAQVYQRGADLARTLQTETINNVNGQQALACREAIGVVGAIVPWNSPQVLLALKVSAALAAGCTVVAKPSPETSLDAYILAEIFGSAGLPAGVVNIVTGAAATGEALVRHDDVDKISFTGSTMAGRSIASICGSKLREVTAELGGKSAAVLLEDADLDLFASLITQRNGDGRRRSCRRLPALQVHIPALIRREIGTGPAMVAIPRARGPLSIPPGACSCGTARRDRTERGSVRLGRRFPG
jgi:aldehyde dehydrogenase (NAD+)